MKAALYRMDNTVYTPELLHQMLQYAPNADEVSILKFSARKNAILK